MSKTITTTIQQIVDNSANGISVDFYYSDAASGNVPHMVVRIKDLNGNIVTSVDQPVSAFKSVTNNQLNTLQNIVLLMVNEIITNLGGV